MTLATVQWDTVMQAVETYLRADTTLIALVPAAAILRAGKGPLTSPTVRWTAFGDALSENENEIVVQFDVIAPSLAKAAAIERRLRDLLHADTPDAAIGGILMRHQYDDSRTHEAPASMDAGTVHRSVDFRFTSAR